MHPRTVANEPLLLAGFLAALLVPAGLAQRPASWARLDLGAPIVASNVYQLGKTGAYLEAGRIHFFSGLTRQWKSAPVAATSPLIRVFNDLAFVVEPSRITAFSAYRGQIEVLPVSASASVLNPVAQRNDSILAVQDGLTLWTFSCFRGVWTSRALASATPSFATQRHVAVLAEGTSLHAMSAFEGTWVGHVAPAPPAALFADGSWGMVETPTTLHGFSAQRNAWSSAVVSASQTQSLKREDCVVYWSNTQATAFSGLRGTFTATTVTGPNAVAADALVVAIASPGVLRLYSAVLSDWISVPTLGQVAPSVQPQIVVWNEAGVLSVYSPFLGSVARLGVGISTFSTNQGVAAAIDLLGRTVHLYSTLTGAWVTAPHDVAVALPDLVWCGALLRTSTGFTAFSGRTGRFVPAATSSAAGRLVDTNSSVIGVEDSKTLFVFEPRREVWLTAAKTGPLVVRIWRTTLLAVDGARVLGYGSQAGEIETYTLPAPPTDLAANSESLRAGVDKTLVCFGASPDIGTYSQFPEFRRVYTLGAPIDLQLTAAPGAQALAVVGAPSRLGVPLPPFGEFLLDPAWTAIAPLGTLPADGRVVLRFVLPDVAVLRGLDLGFQGFVAPAAGTPYLTRLATVGLH